MSVQNEASTPGTEDPPPRPPAFPGGHYPGENCPSQRQTLQSNISNNIVLKWVRPPPEKILQVPLQVFQAPGEANFVQSTAQLRQNQTTSQNQVWPISLVLDGLYDETNSNLSVLRVQTTKSRSSRGLGTSASNLNCELTARIVSFSNKTSLVLALSRKRSLRPLQPHCASSSTT